MLNSYYIDCYQGGREMSKKAEEAALKMYPVKDYNKEPNYNIHTCDTKMLDEVYREVFKFGYRQAEKDIISLIESRILEILGDAQPNPVLRIELQGIIDKIK